jgi:transposase-like protein
MLSKPSTKQEKTPMAVKQKNTEVCKQEMPNKRVSELSQLDLPAMSLMSLLQFGSATLLKEAIANEITEYLGRSHYQHGIEFKGHRNGSQKTQLDTPMGAIEYDRPKVAYAPNFKSQYHVPHMRRPEEFSAAITDMYINGVSTRKVKDSLKAVAGKKLRMSKSTVSRVTKQLRSEFAVWQKRRFDDREVAYLFLDAIRVGMRMGGTGKDAVLLAYAIMVDGTMELLSIDLGHSESDRSWGKFVEDMKARGLKDPMLVCSDGNQGVIAAIDCHFTTSYRQRCVRHREENILDAVPVAEQEPVKEALKKIFYGATSLEQAKQFVNNFKKEFNKRYPTATDKLMTDLDQCLAFYLFPVNHWRRMRTANKIERLNRELKRRIKVIGRHPDEGGCLSLIFAVAKKYAKDQQRYVVTEFEIAIWQKLRNEKIQMLKQLELDVWAS